MGKVRRASAGGFSLFELLVVLMIIAIAGAFVVPAVQSGWQSRQIRQGTRQLAAVMRSLRERAVRRGVEQELVLDPDGETLTWSGERAATLPEGAAITGVRGGWRDDDGRVRVIFYPNGGATGFGAVVSGRQETARLSFAVDVDPLVGSVTIRRVARR